MQKKKKVQFENCVKCGKYCPFNPLYRMCKECLSEDRILAEVIALSLKNDPFYFL